MNKPLFAFDLNITQSCNLRCKYCIQDFDKKLKVMDPTIIKHVKQKINFLLENKDFRSLGFISNFLSTKLELKSRQGAIVILILRQKLKK